MKLKRTITAVTYCGLALATSASSYLEGIGKGGFSTMELYDWLKFTLLMVIALFTTIRALLNRTFSGGKDEGPK